MMLAIFRVIVFPGRDTDLPASGGANGFDGVKARTGHAGRGFDTRRLHSVDRPLMRQRRNDGTAI